MNYKTLDAEMVGRCRDQKKLGNNTYAVRHGDYIGIKLHNTEVVKHFQNGDTVLDSGGWKTVTTKDRMNAHSGIRVTQNNSIWYADGNPFADGMRFKADGSIAGAGKETQKKTSVLKKRIAAYAKDYVTALIGRKVPAPGAGDCFYCVMRTVDGNIPLGEAIGNHADHIHDHLREKYYVPSLVTRAIEIFPISIMAKNIFAYTWNPEYQDKPIEGFIADIARDQIGKSLKRYLYRQVGLAA